MSAGRNNDSIKVSVVIPAFNEEATIIGVLERVKAQKVDDVEFEVVVIDDGSRDGTVKQLEQHPHLYSQFVKLPQNQGKGAAVKAGLKSATGDFILFQDADLEYNPSDYKTLLFPVREFGAQVVMGSRLMAPPYTRVYYFWHKMGNKLITLFFNVLNNTTFTDVYSCYLMYRRSLLDVGKLQAMGWDQHAEILTKVVRKANIIYEVPVTYEGRTYAEGKKIRAHHIFSVLYKMIAERFIPTQ
jgi:glycosyltransferase involved in cell wall biosynthesis